MVDITTPVHELKALDAMKCSRMWMTTMTLGHELRALDPMYSSGLSLR